MELPLKSATVIDRLTIRFDFKNKNRELHMIIGEIPVFSKKWANEQAFDDRLLLNDLENFFC